MALLRALIGARVDADPGAAADAGRSVLRGCRWRCGWPPSCRCPAGVPLAELAGELADVRRRLDLLDAGGDPAHRGAGGVLLVLPAPARRLPPGCSGCSACTPAPTWTVRRRRADRHQPRRQAAGLLACWLALTSSSRPVPAATACMTCSAPTPRASLATRRCEAEQRAALTRLFDYYLHAAAAAMDTVFPAERHRRPRIPPPPRPVPPLTDPAAARAWLDAERAEPGGRHRPHRRSWLARPRHPAVGHPVPLPRLRRLLS